jgi:hypothetical protein
VMTRRGEAAMERDGHGQVVSVCALYRLSTV